MLSKEKPDNRLVRLQRSRVKSYKAAIRRVNGLLASFVDEIEKRHVPAAEVAKHSKTVVLDRCRGAFFIWRNEHVAAWRVGIDPVTDKLIAVVSPVPRLQWPEALEKMIGEMKGGAS